MLLIDKGEKGEQFFRSAPMTTGGTSAAEKERDPSLQNLEGNDRQPPTPVSEAEVKMVSDGFVDYMGKKMDLAEEFKKDPAGVEDMIVEYLNSKHRLGG
jgi:hypothetical protein